MNSLVDSIFRIFNPMNRYTVLYTCSRGYNCFRKIVAPNEKEAALICQRVTHNFGELTEVRPYVGQ